MFNTFLYCAQLYFILHRSFNSIYYLWIGDTKHFGENIAGLILCVGCLFFLGWVNGDLPKKEKE